MNGLLLALALVLLSRPSGLVAPCSSLACDTDCIRGPSEHISSSMWLPALILATQEMPAYVKPTESVPSHLCDVEAQVKKMLVSPRVILTLMESIAVDDCLFWQ